MLRCPNIGAAVSTYRPAIRKRNAKIHKRTLRPFVNPLQKDCKIVDP